MKYGEVAAVVDGVEVKYATKAEAARYSDNCQDPNCSDCEPIDLQSAANWRQGR